MNITIRREISSLRQIGFNSCCFYPDDNCYQGSPFIDFYAPGYIGVDVYTWDKEMSGDVSPWDVDICDERRLIIPFSTKKEFIRAYRIARLCVRVPTYSC